MSDKITTMQLHESTLKLLYEQKSFGETYEDVLLKLLQKNNTTEKD